MYHIPVLLNESLEGLDLREGGVYVDVTFGGGGHSNEILKRLHRGKLYSFDQDADAAANAETGAEGRTGDSEFRFIAGNFRYLKNWMRYYGETDADDEHPNVDGILADLGVSSHHLDDQSRGFSFRFDSPIDMRMNKRAGKTAADILNEYTEEQLADVFYLYGEVKQARRLASLIARRRQEKAFRTTGDLMEVCDRCLPKERSKKEAAKVFQALRIEVNHEMDALKEMLEAAIKVLKPGGRLAVITYHSLEDRIVKNFIKTGNAQGKTTQDLFGRTDAPLTAVNRKPILPSDEEQGQNPRSRSAKLRVAEKGNTMR
ncbi:MAG: 16S rRNA (cytosine(1402)-N(4))-methyltransferase RsmH [Bacteroidaceae bacterium]|nr:16S rRNA (cytosine(1402)-N(4))-methyltransferase RsmH [Bacteroidaceae bacterium]